MRFCEQLNEYITRLDCRGKELAEAAGLSAPSLSRYRTGERTPGRDSAVLTALSDALADMAKAKALPDMTRTHCIARSCNAMNMPARTGRCCVRTSMR